MIKNCLNKDINKRYNIQQLVNHPFVKGYQIILDEKEKLYNAGKFVVDLMVDNILNFNEYIKNVEKTNFFFMIFLFLDENDIIKYNIKLIFIIFDKNNKGAMIYAFFDIHSTLIWEQFSSSTLFQNCNFNYLWKIINLNISLIIIILINFILMLTNFDFKNN